MIINKIEDYILSKEIEKLMNTLEKLDYGEAKHNLLKLKWNALRQDDTYSYELAETYYDCIDRLEKFYKK